jgi:hypothetical protein
MAWFPADTDLNKAFRLAYCLHPHLPTALRITQEALFDRFAVLGITQRKRQRQRTIRRQTASHDALRPAFYKLPLTRHELLQASIYAVSERWECDQERQSHLIPDNGYRPTRDDRLVRYVKLLITRTMDRPALYAALGFGCHLYQYNPSYIIDLAPEAFPAANARRINSYLLEWIATRFPALPIEPQPPYSERKVCTTAATPQERQLLYDALARLTPWGTAHLRRAERRFTSLRALFDDPSTLEGKAWLKREARRIHALIDPQCAGFEVLVRAYQAAFTSENKAETMPMDNPYDKLALPAFAHGNDCAPTGGDRFNPAPLSPEARLILQDAYRRQQQRRRQYRPGLLSVRVDESEQARFDPCTGACPPVYIPLSASSVEVYGQDATGELLLAAFPLAALLGAAEDSMLCITHPGGQTFTFARASEAEMPADAAEGCMVRLTYTEVSPPLLARVWEDVRSQWHRVETWLQSLFLHPWVPTCATALLLVLVASNVWLGVLSERAPAPPAESVSRGAASAATVRVKLAFRSSSTEREIRVLLQRLEAHLVGGPLRGPEDGYYLVEIPLRPTKPNPSAEDLARLRQEMLERLRQVDLVRDARLASP